MSIGRHQVSSAAAESPLEGLTPLIKEYKIVSSWGEPPLEEEVNKMLKDGWIPQGGVSFVQKTGESGPWYVQAMVRVDNNDQIQPRT